MATALAEAQCFVWNGEFDIGCCLQVLRAAADGEFARVSQRDGGGARCPRGFAHHQTSPQNRLQGAGARGGGRDQAVRDQKVPQVRWASTGLDVGLKFWAAVVFFQLRKTDAVRRGIHEPDACN